MERKSVERELKQRIQTGKIRREDVTRRLAELAFGKANDCVRLALEDEPRLDKLDLSLLSEVKRNDKGTVEIKLIDRLQALEQLATVADGEQPDMDDFLKALQGGGKNDGIFAKAADGTELVGAGESQPGQGGHRVRRGGPLREDTGYGAELLPVGHELL